MKKTYRLRIVSRDQQVHEIDLAANAVVVAEAGARYAVVDAQSHAVVADVVVKRQGQALLITDAEGEVVRIDAFYGSDKAAAVVVGDADGAGNAVMVTEATPAAAGTDVVWQPSAQSHEAAAPHAAAEGGPSPWLLGGLAALGGVVAAAAGGGGGGSAAHANAVSVTVVGGPVLAGNDLHVQLYSADGHFLGNASLDAQGHITVNVGDYRGVVIAKVAHSADGNADYLDEATGAGKALAVDLYAAGVITGTDQTLSLNLNLLSTLAYHKAVEAAGSDPLAGGSALTTTRVNDTNHAVADAFGLADLHTTSVVTVNGTTTYNAADGVSNAEKYGEVLAALSGADVAHGGDTAATLDALMSGLTLASTTTGSGSSAVTTVTASLSGEATRVVNQGADIVDQAVGTHTLATVAADTTPTVLQLGLSASGAQAQTLNEGDTVTVTVRLSEAVDVSGTPQLALQVGSAVLTADYVGGTGTGTLTFSATVPAGAADANGIAIGADALSLNGGSIVSAANGQALVLAHAALADNPEFKVDTAAPAVALTAATDDVGPVVGMLTSGDRTDDTALLLSGACEAGAVVKVYDGSTLLGTAAVSGDTWSYTATVVDGTTHQFNVTATDAAGNTSAPSANFTVVGDTTAPTVTVGSIALGADTGSGAHDFLTHTAAQTVSATLSAPLAADERLLASADGGAHWSDITGMVSGTAVSWSGVTLAGSSQLQFQVRDGAGLGGALATQAYTLDTSAPDVALGTATDDAGPVVGMLTSGDRTDDTALLLGGTCEAGAVVKVYDGSTLLGTATVSGTSWSYTATVVDGTTHQFNVTATDAAGNTSAPSASFTVIGDTTAPSVTVGSIALSADTGSGAHDFLTHTAAQTVSATLSAPLAADERLLASADGGAHWSDITGMVSGTAVSWSGVTLAGSSQLQFQVRDGAGLSGALASQAYTLDTSAPAATLATATDDTGSVTGTLASGDTTDDTALLLSGTCEAGAVVKVYDGLTLLGTATVSGTTWSYSATVADGTTYQFNATATDAAGNTSTPTAGFTVIGDTSAPAVSLGAATDDAGSVVGMLTNGDRTDDTALALTGTCEAGAVVKVYDGLNYLGTATVSGTTWSYTATVADGTTYHFNATATDAAGNTSAATASFTVVGDTTAPTVPTLVATDNAGLITGTLNSGDTTDDSTLQLSGACEAGAVVKVYDGLNYLGDAVVSGTSWSYTATVADATTYQFNVTATDAAGNTSAPSTGFTVTGDTTAPTTGVSAIGISADSGASASDFITQTAAQTVSATLSAPLAAGEVLMGSVDGGATWTDITGMASGTSVTWTGVTLAAGSHTLQLAVSDAAGNAGPVGSQAYTLDTSAPTAAIGSVADDAGSVVGTLTSGARTDDTALALSGSCEAGAVVKVYDGLNYLGDATVSGTSWSYTATVADATTYHFNVTATDAAGNTSLPSTAFTVIGDTSAPAVAITGANDNVGSVTGTLASGAVTDDTSLVISGSCEAGASVQVYDGLTLLGTATVSGTTWSYTATVVDGTTHQFNAVATDAAGNSSAPTADFSITGDTTAPSAPTALALTPVGGTVVADTLNSTNTHLTAQATIVAGEATNGHAELYIGSTLVASDMSIGGGDTTVDFSTSDGSPTNAELQALIAAGGVASVKLYDEAGNVVGSSVANPTLTVDYAAPTPHFSAANDNVGTVTGNLISGAHTDDTSLVLSGTAEAGSTVHVYDGASLLGDATVSGTSWSYTASVADGTTYQFNVTETDAHGNTSGHTSNFTVVGDTTGPTASLTTASIANTASATVQSSETGTLYLVDSSLTVNTVSDITGASDSQWNSVAITTANQNTSIAATGLGAGTYKAYAVDAAGNLSSASSNTLTVSAGPDNTTVIFDLVHGVSSSHSSRTFDASKSYTIYVIVDSESQHLQTSPSGASVGATFGAWNGGNNLGADDKVVMVGNTGNLLLGDANTRANQGHPTTQSYVWGDYGIAAYLNRSGWLERATSMSHGIPGGMTGMSHSSVQLWNGTAAAGLFMGKTFNNVWVADYHNMMSKLHTQGLG